MKLRDGLSRVAEVFPLPFKCKILVEPRWAAWVFKSGSSGRERSPWLTGETLTITGSKARLSMLSKMTDMASSTNTRFSRCCHKCYFTSLSPFKTFYPQTAKLPGGLLRITAERWVHLTVQKTYELRKHGRWQQLDNDLYVDQEIISAGVKDPFCWCWCLWTRVLMELWGGCETRGSFYLLKCVSYHRNTRLRAVGRRTEELERERRATKAVL